MKNNNKHGIKCNCGEEYEFDHSKSELPLGYDKRCSKCARMWRIGDGCNGWRDMYLNKILYEEKNV